MRKTHQGDLIHVLEQTVTGAEQAGDETVTLRTVLARALLDLAKRAPKRRGRQRISYPDRVHERTVVRLALRRKKTLIARGMPNEAAHEQAAEEAAAKLQSRNIAASTMARRMQQRRH